MDPSGKLYGECHDTSIKDALDEFTSIVIIGFEGAIDTNALKEFESDVEQ